MGKKATILFNFLTSCGLWEDYAEWLYNLGKNENKIYFANKLRNGFNEYNCDSALEFAFDDVDYFIDWLKNYDERMF